DACGIAGIFARANAAELVGCEVGPEGPDTVGVEVSVKGRHATAVAGPIRAVGGGAARCEPTLEPRGNTPRDRAAPLQLPPAPPRLPTASCSFPTAFPGSRAAPRGLS